MATQTFKQLLVWQKAHEFVLAAYKYTNSFPKTELYALTSQFKRAAASIAANIVEGYKKRGKADKARFMNIAQGSIEECQYYLVLQMTLVMGKMIICMFKHISPKFYLLTPNFYILCLI